MNTRRRVSVIATAAIALSLVRLVVATDANAARPFCMYALKEGWSDSAKTEYVTHKAGPNDKSGIPQIVREIKRKIDVRVEFDVYIAKAEDNCFAAVANGKKILVVDVDFLEKIDQFCGTKWGAIQVVAHEVGHHIAGFERSSHENELNADYWSGYILQKLGAAQSAATRAILTIGGEVDSASHPNKHKRAQTIAKGWDDAREQRVDYGYCDGCR